ncbi:hypothetical protein GCM10023108_36300 [Saccharopolyspora hordei]
MPDHVASDEEFVPAPVQGGRACPITITKVTMRGPWGTRKATRVVRSTGVVSADVVECA